MNNQNTNTETMHNPLLDLFKLAKPCESITITDKSQLMDVYKRSMRPTYTLASGMMTSEGCTIILEGHDDRFSDYSVFIPKSIIDQVDFDKFCYKIIDQIDINKVKCENNPNL